MKRHALIISNPGETGASNYCYGVKVDVKNYTDFLVSPLGGGWTRKEITIMDRPTRSDLYEHIKSISDCDYTFIAFCGHGYYSASREDTILELKRGQEYNSLDLRMGSNKRTIILDCCRKIERDIITDSIVAKSFSEDRGRILNLSECRHYFDEKVLSCPKGVVVCHSCAMDETAGDSQSRGGYYSYSILNSAIHWERGKNIDTAKKWSSYSIVKAHSAALVGVKKMSGGTQNPEIDKPRSEPYFPFAIIA